ncbi:MAG: hypothetical protein Q8R76_05515 [Candidatus Omnitrophota bacterium]|nr:hypothetical protein [Candidatus Omnitrophota bacterium]
MVRKEFSESPYAFETYWPEGPGPFPLLFITPLLGRLALFEDLHFERQFAKFYARRGFAAALVDRPFFSYDLGRGLEQVADYVTQAVERNKAVLDTLIDHPLVHPKKVATLGISFGGIINCLWAAEDPRIKCHIFALVGGNLPKIFMTSMDPLMRSYLKSTQDATGLTGNDLLSALKKIFHKDPLQAAKHVQSDQVLMILALWDWVVRPVYGRSLRQALGCPKTIYLPLGHYLSVLAAPLLTYAALRFLKKRLLR